MKISIIIPIYNSENTIEKLINTILEQTYDDYEIILVDDGSQDNSLDLINKMAKIDKRIRVFSKKNEGPGLARKYGYMQAKGDLLFFIDSDDWIYKEDVLKKINDIYIKNEFEILLFNYVRIVNGKNKITNSLNRDDLKSQQYKIDKVENILLGGALWGKIFVKSKMKEEFFFDSKNYEDYYTTYKYLNECNSFNFANEIFYVSNRDNPKSISKVKNISKQIVALEIIEKLYKETKFKNEMKILAFNTYSNNYVMYKQLLNPTTETLKLIYKLEKIKGNIKNVNKKNISIKNRIKYYLTSIEICLGKSRGK